MLDRTEFHVASGEKLPFVDKSFDLVVGKAVLHHLDPVAGSRELARVLAPGGRAAFSEPLGTNPLLVFAREYLPYPHKHERGADRPLTAEDLREWRKPFSSARVEPRQLLSMVACMASALDSAVPPSKEKFFDSFLNLLDMGVGSLLANQLVGVPTPGV